MWRCGVVVWGFYLRPARIVCVCVQGDPGANGPKGPTGPAGPDGKVRGPCFMFHDGCILFQCVRILALCLHRDILASASGSLALRASLCCFSCGTEMDAMRCLKKQDYAP